MTGAHLRGRARGQSPPRRSGPLALGWRPSQREGPRGVPAAAAARGDRPPAPPAHHPHSRTPSSPASWGPGGTGGGGGGGQGWHPDPRGVPRGSLPPRLTSMRATRWDSGGSQPWAPSPKSVRSGGGRGDKVRHGQGQAGVPLGRPVGTAWPGTGRRGVGRDVGCVIREGQLGSVPPPKGVGGGTQTPQQGPPRGDGGQDGRIALSKEPILGWGGG